MVAQLLLVTAARNLPYLFILYLALSVWHILRKVYTTMGTYLAKPVLDKHEDTGEALDCPCTPLSWACVDMQGWRKSMEDAHVAVTGVDAPPLIQYFHRNVSHSMHQALQSSHYGSTSSSADENQKEEPEVTSRHKVTTRAKVFAVFDGHGGPEVARFCERHLVEVMIKQSNWESGDIGGALVKTFHQLDRMIDHPARQEELTQLKMKPIHSVTQDNVDSPDPAMKPLTADIPNKPLTPQRRGQKDRIPTPEKKAKSEDKPLVDVNVDDGDPPPNEASETTNSPTTDQAETSDPAVADKIITELMVEPGDVGGGTADGPDILSVESTDTAEIPPVNLLPESNDVSMEDELSSADAAAAAATAADEEQTAEDKDTVMASTVDDNEDEKISGGDARILIQKLLELSRAKMEMAATEHNMSDVDENVNGHNAATGASRTSSMTPTHTPSRMMNGRKVCTLPDHPIHAGCTSVVAVIAGSILTVANAGDSRAVLCRKGGATEALSLDHKPMQVREMSRITKAGGFVNQFGRVNGNLNLSRSIGDLKYKQTADTPPEAQMITAEPDITQVTLNEGDEFLVIGCDGIWDCLTNEQAVKYVRDRIHSSTPKDIGVEMLDDIVSKDPKVSQGIGGDNMTILIVDLIPKTRPYFVDKKDEVCESDHGMDWSIAL